MDGATVSLLSEISINLSFSFHNDIDDIIENGTSRSCNNFNTDIERKFNVQKFLIIKLIKFNPILIFMHIYTIKVNKQNFSLSKVKQNLNE